MTVVVTIWLALTAVFGVLTTIAVWARGSSRARSLSVGAFLLASPISAISLACALGWPVPLIENVTIGEGKYTIIAVKMIPQKGIYLVLDGGSIPRYYSLPWSPQTAGDVQDAMEKKGDGGQAGIEVKGFKFPWEGEDTGKEGEEGRGGNGGGNFEWSWDQNEIQFWATPPQALPPKEAPAPGIQFGG